MKIEKFRLTDEPFTVADVADGLCGFPSGRSVILRIGFAFYRGISGASCDPAWVDRAEIVFAAEPGDDVPARLAQDLMTALDRALPRRAGTWEEWPCDKHGWPIGDRVTRSQAGEPMIATREIIERLEYET